MSLAKLRGISCLHKVAAVHVETHPIYSRAEEGKSLKISRSSSLSPEADQDSVVTVRRMLSGAIQTKFKIWKLRQEFMTADC